MSSEIDRHLAGLAAATGLTQRFAAVEKAAAGGQGMMLYELASALSAEADGVAGRPWPYRTLLEHITRVLALTPSPVNAELVARLAIAGDDPGQLTSAASRARRAASMLAAGQPAEYLAPLFAARAAAAGPVLGFLGCLAQEMVLRRGRAEDPGIAEVAGRLRDLDHPLAVLPLHLLPAEQELDLPAYHFRGHSAAMPFGPYRPATEHREPALQLLPAVEDVTDDLTSQLICSAVSRWASDSHGQTEARTFRLRAAGPAQLTADLLAILPIQALEGVGVGHIAAHPATVTDVLAVLFAAASSGPAHGGGLAGAYGRLHAWRSLAGLTGAALAEPVPQLADRAAAARYLLFSARSAWYRQVAWDIGIAAFRPGDQVLVILAATDTD